MARPVLRSSAGWSLAQIAAEAGLPRGLARSVAARGYLSPEPHSEVDIVLLRVGAACLDAPDPAEPPAPKATAAKLGRRDALAIRLTRGLLADPATSTRTVLVLAGSAVDVAEDAEDLTALLRRAGQRVTTVLPIGVWKQLLPSSRTHRPSRHLNAVDTLLPTDPHFPTYRPGPKPAPAQNPAEDPVEDLVEDPFA
jgi:hypothetical protein